MQNVREMVYILRFSLEALTLEVVLAIGHTVLFEQQIA